MLAEMHFLLVESKSIRLEGNEDRPIHKQQHKESYYKTKRADSLKGGNGVNRHAFKIVRPRDDTWVRGGGSYEF